MVQKFKTKVEKHTFDDEKRRESLKKRLREQENQRKLIRNALRVNSSAKSRKIVFDDEITDVNGSGVNGNDVTVQNKPPEKPRLFDESGDDGEENYEISIKRQFEGKKGQKLLSLQSKYNYDERFKLDERFHEEDDDDDDDEETSKGNDILDSESNKLENEKAKQLKVLETVLGHSIQPTLKNEAKPRKNILEMVRFDETNEDHKRQENRKTLPDEKEVKKKKNKKLDKEERKRRRKEEAEKNEKLNQPQTTEDKFYKVSDDLKMALMNRKQENGHFSLLEAFSRRIDDEEITEAEEINKSDNNYEEEEEEKMVEVNQILEDNDMESTENRKVRGINKEKFFFVDNDPRIEEGLKFINMKNSEEAEKVIENYDNVRREIRERLRLRWQKHRQMKNPFKKKIGRSNKQRSNFSKKITRKDSQREKTLKIKNVF